MREKTFDVIVVLYFDVGLLFYQQGGMIKKLIAVIEPDYLDYN